MDVCLTSAGLNNLYSHCFPVKLFSNGDVAVPTYLDVKKLKGTVTPDYLGSFLACMDRSELEKKPLLVFFYIFSVPPLIFDSNF